MGSVWKARVRAVRAGVVATALCASLVAVVGSDGAAGASSGQRFYYLSVACPTSGLCVSTGTMTVDEKYVNPFTTQVLTFKPASAGKVTVTPERLVVGTSVNALDCPSSSRCVGAGEILSASKYTGTGTAAAVVFDPASPDKAKQISLAPKPTTALDLSCPSSSQCTAIVRLGVDTDFEFVTFNPATGDVNQPFKLACNGTSCPAFLHDITCPSVAQCTAVGSDEYTFDPRSGAINAAGQRGLTSRPVPNPRTGSPPTEPAQLQLVDCPSTTQCTALGRYPESEAGPQSSIEVTFDPTSGAVNAAGEKTLATGRNATPRGGLSCPSLSQCTAFVAGDYMGGTQTEVTFDPTTGGINGAGHSEIDATPGVLTCTVSRCAVASILGPISLFDPATGKVTGTVTADAKAAALVPKLEQALKNCKKIKNRKKRAACVKRAEQRFS
jgi:hypothetical protein